MASDTAGDPISIGAKDSTADITSLAFDLTACTGTSCNVDDFAVGALAIPQPCLLA